jgi:hypothetical protein
MLWTPKGLSGYGWSFSSTGATRVAAAWGTSVTPAQNSMGTYAQVLSAANVSKDVFGIQIQFNSNAVSAAARDTLVDIGIDAAGGSSYTVLIPTLSASSAAPAIGATGAGLSYFFPVYIPAGSTVAARASVNNATVGTLRCGIRIFGAPRDRRNVIVGSKVLAYGITTATSTMTAVTPGTTSEGTWTSLGTVASGDEPFFWQVGTGVNQGTITATAYTGDLGIGDGSNKAVVIEDRVWQGTTTEQWYDNGISNGLYQAAAGDTVYGRLQCSGTAITGLSMGAWGVK